MKKYFDIINWLLRLRNNCRLKKANIDNGLGRLSKLLWFKKVLDYKRLYKFRQILNVGEEGVDNVYDFRKIIAALSDFKSEFDYEHDSWFVIDWHNWGSARDDTDCVCCRECVRQLIHSILLTTKNQAHTGYGWGSYGSPPESVVRPFMGSEIWSAEKMDADVFSSVINLKNVNPGTWASFWLFNDVPDYKEVDGFELIYKDDFKWEMLITVHWEKNKKREMFNRRVNVPKEVIYGKEEFLWDIERTKKRWNVYFNGIRVFTFKKVHDKPMHVVYGLPVKLWNGLDIPDIVESQMEIKALQTYKWKK